ncbi:hypothetical protein SAMN03159289_01767 [Klebsiella quasipneumoniae]|nr:hypothetical protein SAMN03159418_03051 [Klebsiella quasipneumoniae]SFX65237.1 hypothetical protein SAMN03159289_01767 [Klebsiella quasipneumoniae]SFX89492.1 hypothetical protein SAMN03159364_03316 [Klebsiella quasipneumoniae]SMC81903.1 hypothetical protein SAMN03159480_102399 [Klebsiella quasipneumoniae]
MSAGWRLSPYPAYKRLQYQTVMRLSVGPRKRSAAGQSLKIALFLGFASSPRGEVWGEGKVNAKLCSHFCRVAAFALPGLRKTARSNRYAVICRPAQAQRRLVIPEDCTFLGFARSTRGEVWGEGKVNAKLCSHVCRVAAFALPGLRKTARSNRYAIICRPAQAQRRRAIPEDCTFLGFAPSPCGRGPG